MPVNRSAALQVGKRYSEAGCVPRDKHETDSPPSESMREKICSGNKKPLREVGLCYVSCQPALSVGLWSKSAVGDVWHKCITTGCGEVKSISIGLPLYKFQGIHK